MVYTEHEHQMRLVAWFRSTYKGVRIFAIPNGGHRHKVVAAQLKREGVTAGVPDLYIPAWKLWVEMKTETGRLSPAQKEWKEYLEGVGDCYIIGMGYDDAVLKIKLMADETKIPAGPLGG